MSECWHFWQICDIFELSSAHACHVLSVTIIFYGIFFATDVPDDGSITVVIRVTLAVGATVVTGAVAPVTGVTVKMMIQN